MQVIPTKNNESKFKNKRKYNPHSQMSIVIMKIRCLIKRYKFQEFLFVKSLNTMKLRGCTHSDSIITVDALDNTLSIVKALNQNATVWLLHNAVIF